MSRQYIFFRKDGTPSRPVSLASLMVAARGRVLQGYGPFTMTQDGDIVATGMTRQKTLDRLERRLVNGEVGPQYRVRNGAGMVFRCREVVPAIPPLDCNGNDKADLVYSAVLYLFDSYKPRYAGAYVCKLSSQHRFGNAIDFFFDSLVDQDKVADYFVAHADEYSIEHVISRDRIWTRGVGWHAYTGDYHYHIHIDFDPNFTTSLPCGVRP
jgi:hypothetical protein